MFIVHYVSYVMCHVSCVTCHVSRVMCHMSHIFFFSSLIGQRGAANWWRVCYQWGLPHLVLFRYQRLQFELLAHNLYLPQLLVVMMSPYSMSASQAGVIGQLSLHVACGQPSCLNRVDQGETIITHMACGLHG